MNRELTLPNFLGIGAQKCGTTWLDMALRTHPQIHLPKNRKELHFFDRAKYRGKSLKWYSRYFADGKVNGEITPSYAILGDEKIDYIKEVIPDVKLVFLIRNPIDRAWSMVKSQFIEDKEYKVENYIKHFVSNPSIIRGDYYTCLANWMKKFDRDQIFVGYFNSILDDPKSLLDDIAKHIGCTIEHEWEDSIIKKRVKSGSITSGFKEKKANPLMPPFYESVLKEIYLPKLKKLNELESNKYLSEWIDQCAS